MTRTQLIAWLKTCQDAVIRLEAIRYQHVNVKFTNEQLVIWRARITDTRRRIAIIDARRKAGKAVAHENAPE